MTATVFAIARLSRRISEGLQRQVIQHLRCSDFVSVENLPILRPNLTQRLEQSRNLSEQRRNSATLRLEMREHLHKKKPQFIVSHSAANYTRVTLSLEIERHFLTPRFYVLLFY